jgi:Xaa-Pro aminopeptidase
MNDELAAKRARLLPLLDEAGLDALLLSAPGNIAWYAGGARTQILQGSDRGVADLLVTRAGDILFTDTIEADRLVAEELVDLDLELRVRAWHEDRASSLPSGRQIGSDLALPGCGAAATVVRRAREVLTGPEVDRYRALGRDAAAAVTAAALELTPDRSEQEAAARLAAELHARGAEPLVLLVAGAARLTLYRHPLPTARQLCDRAMLVVCARRAGLICALTRIVAFTAVGDGERDAYERLLRVDAAFQRATRPGRRLGEVLGDAVAAYAAEGFDREEWQRHHQGGPIGYFGRDEFVTPASGSLVADSQAFAWNPSVAGSKVEDTVLTTGSGIEVLSVDESWPAVTVDGLCRPGILER